MYLDCAPCTFNKFVYTYEKLLFFNFGDLSGKTRVRNYASGLEMGLMNDLPNGRYICCEASNWWSPFVEGLNDPWICGLMACLLRSNSTCWSCYFHI